MKKVVGVIAIVAGLFMLSGCGGTNGDPDKIVNVDGYKVQVVHVQVDGRSIPCIFSENGRISCDWSSK